MWDQLFELSRVIPHESSSKNSHFLNNYIGEQMVSGLMDTLFQPLVSMNNKSKPILKIKAKRILDKLCLILPKTPSVSSWVVYITLLIINVNERILRRVSTF